MALKWNLTEVLERVANSRTGPPAEPEKVVTMPGLDKLAKAIRQLQTQLIEIEGEEHKLLIAFREVERESETLHSAIQTRRSEVQEQMTRLQGQMVEAVKACGIAATIPGGTNDPV
jgi:hypothetical protein